MINTLFFFAHRHFNNSIKKLKHGAGSLICLQTVLLTKKRDKIKTPNNTNDRNVQFRSLFTGCDALK